VQITAVKIYEQKKNIATSAKLIKALCLRLYFFCTSQSGRLEYKPLFVELGGLGCEGATSEKFVSKAMDENGDGFHV